MLSVFHYYYFDGFKVDVFGYNEETGRYVYSVETPYSSKVREAKPYDLANIGQYINIISPRGKRLRLILY